MTKYKKEETIVSSLKEEQYERRCGLYPSVVRIVNTSFFKNP